MNTPKRVFALLVLVLILAGLIVTVVWVRNQLGIDSCLDQGGRWDYRRDSCDNARVT